MPTLKYFVGDVASAHRATTTPHAANAVDLMLPLTDSTVDASRTVAFEWVEVGGAASYRIEIESAGKLIITSTVQGTRYTPPTGWLASRVQGGALWRVTALDASGSAIAQSVNRRFALRG